MDHRLSGKAKNADFADYAETHGNDLKVVVGWPSNLSFLNSAALRKANQNDSIPFASLREDWIAPQLRRSAYLREYNENNRRFSGKAKNTDFADYAETHGNDKMVVVGWAISRSFLDSASLREALVNE
jgi:hypothetical protein